MKKTALHDFAKENESWMALRIAFVAVILITQIFRFCFSVQFTAVQAVLLYPLTAGFGALALAGRDIRKRPDIRILLFYLLWTVVATLWNFQMDAAPYAETIHHVIFDALVCYPVALSLRPETGKKAVHFIMHAFCIVIAALCLLAIVMTVQGRVLSPVSDGSYVLGRLDYYDNRLAMFMHPNLTGACAGLAVLIGIYMVMAARHTWVKGAYIIITLLAFVALALTDSRTSMLAVCAGMAVLGLVVCTSVLHGKNVWLKWGAGVAGAAALAVACFFAFSLAFSGVTLLENAVQGMSAKAESQTEAAEAVMSPYGMVSPTQQQPRDMTDGLRDANGRTLIWNAARDAIREQPMILLRGTSQEHLKTTIAPYLGFHSMYDHLHNSYLQVLVAIGLPGLIALLAFLVYVCRYALPLCLGRYGPRDMASRFLPAIPLSLLIIGLTESLLFMEIYWLFDGWLFLVAGLIVALGSAGAAARRAG